MARKKKRKKDKHTRLRITVDADRVVKDVSRLPGGPSKPDDRFVICGICDKRLHHLALRQHYKHAHNSGDHYEHEGNDHVRWGKRPPA